MNFSLGHACSTLKMTLLSTSLLIMYEAQAQQYDFVWYSGAYQTWSYEAGPMLFVNVSEDSATAENDVLFELRNGINTPLGYLSAILEVEVDTGTANPDMFTSLSMDGYTGYVNYRQYIPTNTFLSMIGGRIAWSGDYAFGGLEGSAPKADAMNPGESVTLRAVLKDGLTFQSVIDAMNLGMSSTYVDGIYTTWTTAEKQAYRAGATQGLRFNFQVASTVPNTWNPEGHGAYVTSSIVAVPEVDSWAMMLVGVGLLGVVMRYRLS